MLKFSLGEEVATLCRSSLMHSVQSFELDDNCLLAGMLDENELHFGLATRLTHVRISLWDFSECVRLLNEIGPQLHSLTVTIASVFDYIPNVTREMRSVSKISRFDISIHSLI
jgi:hypothetical protein